MHTGIHVRVFIIHEMPPSNPLPLASSMRYVCMCLPPLGLLCDESHDSCILARTLDIVRSIVDDDNARRNRKNVGLRGDRSLPASNERSSLGKSRKKHATYTPLGRSFGTLRESCDLLYTCLFCPMSKSSPIWTSFGMLASTSMRLSSYIHSPSVGHDGCITGLLQSKSVRLVPSNFASRSKGCA